MVIEKMIFQSPSKTSSNISNSQLEYRVLAFSQSAEEADFQSVSEQKKSDIEARMEKTEAAIDQLIGYFQGHGYEVAATYMRRAKIGMFGYVRRWLKWGLISPRATGGATKA